MGEEGEGVSVIQVVDQIKTSLCNAIPELVLRMQALSDQNAVPNPEVFRSVEGVAKAGDALAETCTDLANDEYEEFPEIKDDILDSAKLVTSSCITLRRASIMLNQVSTGDRAPSYKNVMTSCSAIAAACVHVLDVVYGSFYRRAQIISEDTCVLMRQKSDATLKASLDEQAYADTVSDLCSKANEVARNLGILGENERDPVAAAQLTDLSNRVQAASDAFLDRANEYLANTRDENLRASAQKAQDELLAVLTEAAALVSARKNAIEKKEPAPEEKPEEEAPSRPSLASQMAPIEVPLTYLMLVAEQKRQCDLVDDLVATAKGGMRQPMVEDGRELVKRHTIITVQAGELCESDMAHEAVDDTAEKSDVSIRKLIKCSGEAVDDPEDEEKKKVLVAAASEYKVLVMKYSDDCLLKPDTGRELTVCQRLRVAINENRSSDEILSLLEEAIGEYNYRAERVQDQELKADLLEQVGVIDKEVRAFAGNHGEEERNRALDAMDVFENMIIAYLLSLVEKALVDTSSLVNTINSQNLDALDAGSKTLLMSVTEVSTETRDISEQYTGCVEGTQDEFACCQESR